MNNTNSTEERKEIFLKKARAVHGDRYDYSKVVYTRAKDKVEIVCPDHGSFFQSPDSHPKMFGCKFCRVEEVPNTLGFSGLLTTEEFLGRCKKEHLNKYDVSKVVYMGKHNKVMVICPTHGEFHIRAETFRGGAGCRACGIIKAHTHFRATTEEFIGKARAVHGDKYDYSCANYTGKTKPITITCKVHGDFTLTKAAHHYLGHKVGCIICTGGGVSKQELEVVDLVKSLGFSPILNSRAIITPLELDIVIKEKRVAIEYNGVYWHSEAKGKHKEYHLGKLNSAKAAGYSLIQIFEHEWLYNKEAVKNRVIKALIDSKVLPMSQVVEASNPDDAEVFLSEFSVSSTTLQEVVTPKYKVIKNELGSIVACVSYLETSDEYYVLNAAATPKYKEAILHILDSFNGTVELSIDLRWFSGKSLLAAGFLVKSRTQPKVIKARIRGGAEHTLYDCGYLNLVRTNKSSKTP